MKRFQKILILVLGFGLLSVAFKYLFDGIFSNQIYFGPSKSLISGSILVKNCSLVKTLVISSFIFYTTNGLFILYSSLSTKIFNKNIKLIILSIVVINIIQFSYFNIEVIRLAQSNNCNYQITK